MGQREMELREKCYDKEFKRSNKLYGSLCDDGSSGVILHQGDSRRGRMCDLNPYGGREMDVLTVFG